jgi:hypothetical protein
VLSKFSIFQCYRIYRVAFSTLNASVTNNPIGMRVEIDGFSAFLAKKIEVNKIPNDRLERVIRATIKDLEKRKDKAMVRSETD